MAKRMTGKELVAFCRSKIGTPYDYGMKGKVMTEQNYKFLKNTYGKMVWLSDREKIGKVCVDCSGLISWACGVTLGSGASLPFAGGKFWMMGHNYATARTLDNGPIRTSVELTYAPFDVDGTPVTLTKIISLDANQRFNRMDNIYEGAFTEMPIAAGFVRHDVKQILTGEGWMALCEAVSDSKDPARDGDIYLGVILPGAEMLTDTLGHAVAVKAVKPGRTLTYYAGSGWSQGGVEDMKEWIEEIGQAQAAAVTPLKVTVLN